LDDPYPVFYQLSDQDDNGFLAFFIGSMDLFSTGQTQRFHALILADLHDFANGKIQVAFMPELLQYFYQFLLI
jgi:hypothetical protein